MTGFEYFLIACLLVVLLVALYHRAELLASRRMVSSLRSGEFTREHNLTLAYREIDILTGKLEASNIDRLKLQEIIREHRTGPRRTIGRRPIH